MYLIKSKLLNVLKYKVIALGSLPVRELTILEYKPWFSIKVFHFMKGDAQERYHTHSFNSYSFRLFGDYVEKILFLEQDELGDFKEVVIPKKRSRKRWLNFPKNRYHQITESNGCMTVLFTGPWGKTFKEYYDGEEHYLTDGRIKA